MPCNIPIIHAWEIHGYAPEITHKRFQTHVADNSFAYKDELLYYTVLKSLYIIHFGINQNILWKPFEYDLLRELKVVQIRIKPKIAETGMLYLKLIEYREVVVRYTSYGCEYREKYSRGFIRGQYAAPGSTILMNKSIIAFRLIRLSTANICVCHASRVDGFTSSRACSRFLLSPFVP